MPEYKWDHPLDWLSEYIERSSTEDLRIIVRQLAEKLDGDQIQDLFQDEMDADGYFKPLRKDRRL